MTWSTLWIHQPQRHRVRRLLFQIHLWIGVSLAAYVALMCVTGSVLVYRNELYETFSPTAGDPAPLGFRATTWLLDLHDNLLFGDVGRRTNGVGAALILLLTLTGMIVWWPGIQRWRRSAVVDFAAKGRQFNWSLHSALGIWFAGFILMWGITGLYLSYPPPFNQTVEYFFPIDEETGFNETGDSILFWLGYAHFGRFGGRIPGCSRGTCNEVFKAAWALAGFVPVIMAVTGVSMWWSRVRRTSNIGRATRSWRKSRPTSSRDVHRPWSMNVATSVAAMRRMLQRVLLRGNEPG